MSDIHLHIFPSLKLGKCAPTGDDDDNVLRWMVKGSAIKMVCEVIKVITERRIFSSFPSLKPLITRGVDDDDI